MTFCSRLCDGARNTYPVHGLWGIDRANQLSQKKMPRPGIEPGPEVPETSVMSFSLPGRRVRQRTELHQRYAADKARIV